MEPTLYSVIDETAHEARDDLLNRAARMGFVLVNYPTSQGQMIWEWRHGDGPRPKFVTERVARQWMTEWIERNTPDQPDALAAARHVRQSAAAVTDVAESA